MISPVKKLAGVHAFSEPATDTSHRHQCECERQSKKRIDAAAACCWAMHAKAKHATEKEKCME